MPKDRPLCGLRPWTLVGLLWSGHRRPYQGHACLTGRSPGNKEVLKSTRSMLCKRKDLKLLPLSGVILKWDGFAFVPLKISSNEHITDTLLSHLSAQLISYDTAMTGLLLWESSHCGSTVSCQHAKTDSMVQMVYMKQRAKPLHLWRCNNYTGQPQPTDSRF